MPAEPFDIGTLVPPGARRVKLEIRLQEESVGLRVIGAEDQDGAMKAVAGGAVLWRAPGAPVLLSVPPGLALVIDVDTAAPQHRGPAPSEESGTGSEP